MWDLAIGCLYYIQSTFIRLIIVSHTVTVRTFFATAHLFSTGNGFVFWMGVLYKSCKLNCCLFNQYNRIFPRKLLLLYAFDVFSFRPSNTYSPKLEVFKQGMIC